MISIPDLRVGVDAIAFQAKPAGVARYLRNILAHLISLFPSMRFILYSSQPIEPPLPRGNWTLRSETRSGLPGKTQFWLQRTLPRWLQEDDVDLFWGQNNGMPLWLRHRCARLLTIHDLTSVMFLRTMNLRHGVQSRLTIRAAARASDRVIAVSQATGSLVRRKLGVPRERIEVVYEGIDESLVRTPRVQAAELLEARFNLPPPFLLAVSTVEPRKDYPTLIRALRSAAPRLPTLAIAGGVGWRCGAIMADIERAQQEGLVRYLGRVSDEELSALYSAADLTVYSSVYEGFGLPVLEAMSCGCPVLCSWTSSLPEVGGDAACYFRPRDTRDLAAKLTGLVADPERRSRMAERGLERAREIDFREAALQTMEIMYRTVNDVRGCRSECRAGGV